MSCQPVLSVVSRGCRLCHELGGSVLRSGSCIGLECGRGVSRTRSGVCLLSLLMRHGGGGLGMPACDGAICFQPLGLRCPTPGVCVEPCDADACGCTTERVHRWPVCVLVGQWRVAVHATHALLNCGAAHACTPWDTGVDCAHLKLCNSVSLRKQFQPSQLVNTFSDPIIFGPAILVIPQPGICSRYVSFPEPPLSATRNFRTPAAS